MTSHAELHRKGFFFVAERHAIHFSVTTGATDTLGDVNTVIEINVVWQISDPVPHDRLIIREALSHWCQQIRVRPNLRMTGHACVSWRQAGIGRHLDGGVAESAIDSQTSNMVFVAERHRLLNRPADVAHVIGARP